MLKKKPQTVSERITELIARDVENSSDSDDAQDAPRVEQEFDEYDVPDTRSSDIRKRNVKLLSEQSVRYRGKITSRNELEQDSDKSSEESDSDVDTSDDDEALQAYSKQLKKQSFNSNNNKADDSVEEDDDVDEDSDNAEDEEESAEEEDEDDDDEDYDESVDGEDEEDEQATDIIAETNRQAEIQKGQCVQNQLRIWERLLELRIHSQKLLSKANQLPPAEALKSASNEHEELAQARSTATTGLSTLLNSMVQLQSSLCAQFSEQRNAMKKTLKRRLPVATGDSTEEPALKRFSEHLATHFEELRPYRNTVLLKWDDRTKLLVPGAGSKRKSLTDEFDIVKKIENALQQRSTLIKRSQVPKTANQQQQAVEEGAEQINGVQLGHNVEIYDDSDFYHQQLRELIEHKTNSSVNASEITQQYVELQKLRQKMKKKVDQRASKGRKLRYTVHKKLVNFMAPDDTSSWTEESKNELYKSLFAA